MNFKGVPLNRIEKITEDLPIPVSSQLCKVGNMDV